MNPLDRRIAELKGWQQLPFAKSWHKPLIDPMGPEQAEEVFTWSVYDAKAFQLVDELMMIRPTYFAFGMECAPSGVRWYAHFAVVKDGMKEAFSDHFDPPFSGEAFTRPEAICKAYILAREFLARKPEVDPSIPRPVDTKHDAMAFYKKAISLIEDPELRAKISEIAERVIKHADSLSGPIQNVVECAKWSHQFLT